MHVEIRVDRRGVGLDSPQGSRRIEGVALRQIRDIGRLAPILTDPHPQLGEELRVQGAVLWASLFGDWQLPPAEKLEIEIDVHPPLPLDLAAIPWECLVDPATGVPAAYHQDITIFRSGAAPQSPAMDPEAHVLRGLILAPRSRNAPDEKPLASLDAPKEIRKINEHVDSLVGEGLASLEVLGPARPVTFAAVREALERHQPHVLHFIGHGQTNLAGAQSSRFLFDRDGSGDWIDESRLLHWFLHLERSPELVVLNACHSSGPPVSAGLPLKLQRLGARAVIAMRSAIFDQAAVDFSSTLYRHLANAEALGTVCQAARHEILDPGDSGHWILPLLYARDPSARILAVREDTPAAGPATRKIIAVPIGPSLMPLKGLHPYDIEDADGFFGRDDEISGALRLFSQHRKLLLSGDSGTGKTSLIKAGLIPRLLEHGLQPLYAGHWRALHRELLERMGLVTSSDQEPRLDQVLNVLDAREVPPVLIFDQVEDSLAYDDRASLLAAIAERQDRVAGLIFVVRSDARHWFWRQLVLFGITDVSVADLPAMSPQVAEGVLDGLGARFGLDLEDGLAERILADVTVAGDDPDGPGRVLLGHFSLILDRLYRTRSPTSDRPVLERASYDALGGVESLMPNHLRQVLKALTADEAAVAEALLPELVDAGLRRPVAVEPTRLAGRLEIDEELLRAAVDRLLKAHVLRKLGDGQVILVHQLLAEVIVEHYLPRETIEAQRAKLILRAQLEFWHAQALPLNGETFQQIDAIYPRLELTADELALFVGSAFLRKDPVLTDRLAKLSAADIQAVLTSLRDTGHPEIQALAIRLAADLPAHRRGPAPLEIAVSTLQLPAARHVAESMLHLLAQKLETPDAGSDDASSSTADSDAADSEATKTRQLALLLVTQLEACHGQLNHPRIEPLLTALRISRIGGRFPLALAPLRIPPKILSLVAGLLILIPASWLLALEGITLTQLKYLATFSLTATLGMIAAGELAALRRLMYDSPELDVDVLAWIHRLRGQAVQLAGTFWPTVFVVPLLLVTWTTLTSLSDWLHQSFFVEPIASQLRGWLAAAADLGLGGLLVAAGRALFLLFVGYFQYGIAGLAMGAVLVPAALVLIVAQLSLDQIATWAHRQVSRWLTAAVPLSLAAFLLNPALEIGLRVAELFERYFPRLDFFVGAASFAVFRRGLETLAESPWTALFGATFPIVALAWIYLAGSRRLRLRRWIGDVELLDKNPSMLAALVAEGTPEALRGALRLFHNVPETRDEKSFSMLYALACLQPEAFPEDLDESTKHEIAEEAREILAFTPVEGLDPGRWLEDLKIRLEDATPENRGRLEKLQDTLADLPSAPLAPQGLAAISEFLDRTVGYFTDSPSPTTEASNPWQRFGPYLWWGCRLAIYIFLLLSLVHLGSFLGGHFLVSVLPLREPLGRSLVDFGVVMTLAVRMLELGVIYAVVFGIPSSITHLWRMVFERKKS